MPHLSKRAKLDIPAYVIVEIASKPGKYKEMIAELGERKEAAEEAEGNATVALAALNEANKTFDTKQVDLAVLRGREEARLLETADGLRAEETRLEGVVAKLREREDAVQIRENNVKRDAEDHNALGERLARQAETFEARERQILVDEADLQEREDSLADKEARLRNRARAWLEDLD